MVMLYKLRNIVQTFVLLFVGIKQRVEDIRANINCGNRQLRIKIFWTIIFHPMATFH